MPWTRWCQVNGLNIKLSTLDRSGTNIAAYCEPHVTLVDRIDTVHSMTETLAEKKRWT